MRKNRPPRNRKKTAKYRAKKKARVKRKVSLTHHGIRSKKKK